jgi:hypothetical protein
MRPQKTLAQLLPILSVTAMSLFGFWVASQAASRKTPELR